MIVSFIAAMGENGEIGFEKRMPWRLPADLAFVKRTTMGHTLVMGRRTYESMGKPLPGRTNVVMTQNPDFSAEGVDVVHSVEETLARYGGVEELFIFGGSEIYRLFFPHADRLYITKIHQTFEADTYFPAFDESEWRIVSRAPGERNEKNPYDYEFLVYERANGRV